MGLAKDAEQAVPASSAEVDDYLIVCGCCRLHASALERKLPDILLHEEQCALTAPATEHCILGSIGTQQGAWHPPQMSQSLPLSASAEPAEPPSPPLRETAVVGSTEPFSEPEPVLDDHAILLSATTESETQSHEPTLSPSSTYAYDPVLDRDLPEHGGDGRGGMNPDRFPGLVSQLQIELELQLEEDFMVKRCSRFNPPR